MLVEGQVYFLYYVLNLHNQSQAPGPRQSLPTGAVLRATHLEEDPADATQQLWLLLGVVLDHGVIGAHSQHVVLRG